MNSQKIQFAFLSILILLYIIILNQYDFSDNGLFIQLFSAETRNTHERFSDWNAFVSLVFLSGCFVIFLFRVKRNQEQVSAIDKKSAVLKLSTIICLFVLLSIIFEYFRGEGEAFVIVPTIALALMCATWILDKIGRNSRRIQWGLATVALWGIASMTLIVQKPMAVWAGMVCFCSFASAWLLYLYFQEHFTVKVRETRKSRKILL